MIRSSRTSSSVICAFGLFLCVLILILTISSKNEDSIKLLSYIAVIDCALCLIIWFICYREFLAPIPLIIFALFCFNFGKSFAFILDPSGGAFNIGHTQEIIANAQKYLLLCMNLFFCGCTMARSKYGNQQYSNRIDQSDSSDYYRLRLTCLIIIFISVIPYCMYYLRMLVNSISNGYAFLYSDEYKPTNTSIFGVIGNLFEPAIIGMIIAHKNNKSKRKFYVVIAIICILIKFLIGGRASGVAMAISLVMLLYFEDVHLNKKKILILCVVGYFFIALISAAKNLRTMAGRSIGDYLLAVFSEKGVITDLFKEFGGSLNPTLYTMELVPSSYPFRYGYTYIMALLAIIPNLGFWSVHPAEKYASLAKWVTKAANHTWSGLGYTSTAEAYINFSWAGCIVFLIWGIVITKIVIRCKYSNKNTIINNFIVLSSFDCLFYSFVRGDFRDMVRSFSWCILPILLIYYLVGSSAQKRGRL